MVWLMQNHQFDLQSGQSVRLGAYKVTLLEIEDDTAVLEIEGPDGSIQIEPISCCSSENSFDEELAILA
jgi:hypothetical protein